MVNNALPAYSNSNIGRINPKLFIFQKNVNKNKSILHHKYTGAELILDAMSKNKSKIVHITCTFYIYVL
jgi:hypothetical protein